MVEPAFQIGKGDNSLEEDTPRLLAKFSTMNIVPNFTELWRKNKLIHVKYYHLF